LTRSFSVVHIFVRRASVDLERGVPDDLRREQCRVGNRHDLVIVAMQDERGHVDPLQVD